MPEIEVNVAAKSFGSARILADIRFVLSSGPATALLGRSGVGKTTLLRIIAGLDRDYDGQISASPRVGMVFQEPRLLPWYPVSRNVEVVGVSSGEAARLLRQVGVSDAAGLYPSQLSLGMARRVALARALAVEPELLILDEPFASLDAPAAAGLRRLIADIGGAGRMGVLLVSHDVVDVAALAQRALILAGRPATLVADLDLKSFPEERSVGDCEAILERLKDALDMADRQDRAHET